MICVATIQEEKRKRHGLYLGVEVVVVAVEGSVVGERVVEDDDICGDTDDADMGN